MKGVILIKKLVIFISGFFTGAYLLDVLDSLFAVVRQWIEVALIKPTKKVQEFTKSVQSEGEINTFAVGFQAPEECVYAEEDEDE